MTPVIPSFFSVLLFSGFLLKAVAFSFNNESTVNKCLGLNDFFITRNDSENGSCAADGNVTCFGTSKSANCSSGNWMPISCDEGLECLAVPKSTDDIITGCVTPADAKIAFKNAGYQGSNFSEATLPHNGTGGNGTDDSPHSSQMIPIPTRAIGPLSGGKPDSMLLHNCTATESGDDTPTGCPSKINSDNSIHFDDYKDSPTSTPTLKPRFEKRRVDMSSSLVSPSPSTLGRK